MFGRKEWAGWWSKVLLMVSVGFVLAGCGGGSGEAGEEEGAGDRSASSEVTAGFRPSVLYLQAGESANVEVSKTPGTIVGIDVSETALNLDIDPADCAPARNDCENWRIQPGANAENGGYEIGLLGGPGLRTELHRLELTVLPASPAPAAVAIAAGRGKSFAVTASGEVWGWGNHGDVVTGFDLTQFRLAGRERDNLPKRLEGLSDVRTLAAGDFHTLALDSSGRVFAFGNNGRGQLGDGTEIDRRLPVPVTGLPVITGIAAGFAHSLALAVDGQVYSWGSNSQLQLGRSASGGAARGEDSTPAPVSLQGTAVAVAAFDNQSAALIDDGSVYYWGYFERQSARLPDVGPMQVPGVDAVRAIAMGESLLMLRDDGTVWAWKPEADRLAEPVPGLSGIAAISAGGLRHLALDAQDEVWEWSENHAATRVPDLAGVTAIAAGERHRLALLGDCTSGGTVRAWGRNGSGVLGDGTFRDKETPVPVAGIGEADSSCPQQLRIYLTGESPQQGAVTDVAGAIQCQGTLCWALEPANTVLDLQVSHAGDAASHDWLWDCDGLTGTLSLNDDTYCKLRFERDPVSLQVAIQGQGRVISAPAGIDCGTACSADFVQDAPVRLATIPAAGWQFDRWEGDSVCANGGDLRLQGPSTRCTAVFVETPPAPLSETVTLSLTITGGPGAGEVSSGEMPPILQCINSAEDETLCRQSFDRGSEVALFAQAYRTGTIQSWQGCDRIGEMQECRLTLNDDRSVTADFVQPVLRSMDLTVFGNGRVTSRDGQLDCQGGNLGTCSATYVDSSLIILEQSPGAGARLLSWGGDCADGASLVSYAIGADRDLSCTVSFSGPGPDEAMLCTSVRNDSASDAPGSVLRSANGRAGPTADCSYYARGSRVTLTPQANAGYAFYRWSGPSGCYTNLERFGDVNQPVIDVDLPPDSDCTAVFRDDVTYIGLSLNAASSTDRVVSVRPDGNGGFTSDPTLDCRVDCVEPFLTSGSGGRFLWLRALPGVFGRGAIWQGCDTTVVDPAGGPALCRIDFTPFVGERRDVTIGFL